MKNRLNNLVCYRHPSHLVLKGGAGISIVMESDIESQLRVMMSFMEKIVQRGDYEGAAGVQEAVWLWLRRLLRERVISEEEYGVLVDKLPVLIKMRAKGKGLGV